ncbi:hypothetical protein [Niabella hibiscisoli]|uniref:hypothetical protein n=1 Tax=Niabella hibiscisoli TaxID=1825928 RepID=UPI00374CDA8E
MSCKNKHDFFFNIQAAQTKSQAITEEQIITKPAKLKVEQFDLGIRKARFIRVQVPKTDYFEINYTATAELKLKPVRLKKRNFS